MLRILIPEMERPVAACSAEGPVDRVEGYGVYGVYIADVARVGGGLPVAFETEVRGGVFFFNVLDRAAAFY